MSHVKSEFLIHPKYTANTDGLGSFLRILEAVSSAEFWSPKDAHFIKLLHPKLLWSGAGSSAEKKTLLFYPRSPYAVAKTLRLLDNGELSWSL